MPPSRVKTLKEIYESCIFALTIADPFTYEEATKEQYWQEAMKVEIASIQRNQTWELSDFP